MNKDHGLLEHWLRNVRDVVRKYRKELAVRKKCTSASYLNSRRFTHWLYAVLPRAQLIEDEELRYQRLVELNVQEQCLNLYRNPVVQRQQAQTNLPRVHGFVYDIANGILKKLKVDFASLVERFGVGSLFTSTSCRGIAQSAVCFFPRVCPPIHSEYAIYGVYDKKNGNGNGNGDSDNH